MYNYRTVLNNVEQRKYGSNKTGRIHRSQWRSFHLQSQFVFYFKQFELHQHQPSFQTSMRLYVFRVYFRQQYVQQQQPPQAGSEESHSILHPSHLLETEPEHSDYAAPWPINQVKTRLSHTDGLQKRFGAQRPFKAKKIQCLECGK